MFDVGFWEIALIGVIALLILGPERLPRVARTAGAWVGRARRFVTQVKADINAEIEAEDLAKFRQMGDELKSVQSDIKRSGSSFKDSMEADNKELIDAINQSGPTADAAPAQAAVEPAVATTEKKEKTAAKKTTAKKAVAKKTTVKKTAAKKSAGKKTTGKKTVRKTTLAKTPAAGKKTTAIGKRASKSKTAVEHVSKD